MHLNISLITSFSQFAACAKLKDSLAEVSRKYTQLKNNFDIVQEFVSDNVSVDTQEVSRRGHPHPNRHDRSSDPATSDRWATHRSLLSPSDSLNNASLTQAKAFTPVKNGAKLTGRTKTHLLRRLVTVLRS